MDVSFVLATYNPSKLKLFDTLFSLISQQGIEYEIIVCDDCSVNECIEWCEEFFGTTGFDRYTIVSHEENVGTCKNILDGVLAAKGRYVKPISPGDFLVGRDNLKGWLEFAVENNAKVTYSRIVNYHFEDDKKKICSMPVQPVNEDVYITDGNHYNQKINYCYLSDTPVGAAYLAERELLESYLKLIIGRIRYAEDLIYRLVVLDNITIRMFPYECVAYECNTGISTSTNEKWVKILQDEVCEIYNIAYERNSSDQFVRKLHRARNYTGIKQKLYKIFCVKKYLYWIIKLKSIKSMTAGTDDMLVINR